MKKKWIILSVIAIAVIGLVVGGIIVKSNIEKNLNALESMPISDVDLSKIADGTYEGSYEVFPVAVEVKVTVSAHKIIDIQIQKHSNGQGQAAEVLPDKVIENQSIELDAISGATYSSKVMLKAIENALNNTK